MGTQSFLALGVSGGFVKYGIDPSLLIPYDPDDVLIPEGKVNIAIPNLNSGLFFHSERLYVGFSIYNMIGKSLVSREDVALAYHDFHFYLTAGVLFKLSEEVQLKPSFLVRQIKGSPTNYDLNAMFLFKERLWLGGSYRSNTMLFENSLQEDLVKRNALAAILEIFATPNLRVGYAYDYNLNVLSNYRNNSHEISLGYYLRARKTIMECPRWF